jgi:hypothetical protein
VLTTEYTEFETTGAPDALSYTWSVVPEEAGSIEGEGTMATVYWSGEYFGNVEIMVFGTNACGDGENSESLDVWADLCEGTKEILSEDSYQLFPNPNNGQFKVLFNDPVSSELNIRIVNAAGDLVYEIDHVNVSSGNLLEIDLDGHSEGIYFLYIETGNSIMVEKIIVQ